MTSQSSTPSPLANGINLKRLGIYLDGWGDLVEGMGGKAEEVRNKVLNQLESRNMPDIALSRKTGYANLVSGDKRAYLISETDPGAITTIYTAEHGQDLYVSWRTYIRSVWNKPVLGVLFFVAVVIGALVADNRYFGGFSVFISTTITTVILGCGLIALAGFLLRGNPLAFFFVEPSILDAEDISSMSLSVHYSMLRALDQSGIDTSKLRIKEKFTGGRRGEDI